MTRSERAVLTIGRVWNIRASWAHLPRGGSVDCFRFLISLWNHKQNLWRDMTIPSSRRGMLGTECAAIHQRAVAISRSFGREMQRGRLGFPQAASEDEPAGLSRDFREGMVDLGCGYLRWFRGTACRYRSSANRQELSRKAAPRLRGCTSYLEEPALCWA